MPYKIPLFKLNFDDEEKQAVIQTIESNWISLGPKCQEFEKTFADMLKVKHALSLSSCTSALHLAMILLGIKKGDEVICPSLTFAATVNAIKYVEAKPVFCDIYGVENLNINAEHIEDLITPETKAIMVMHFGGFPCEMDKIMQLSLKYNLFVIEDASHAPLSNYKGRKLGTIGHVGCFSFFSNKNISTGEGGMLITNDEDIFNKAKLLRSHGMTTMSYQRASGHATDYDIHDIGYNYRMDDIRASIGIVQLSKLEEDLRKRSHVRKQYIEYLKDYEEILIPFKNSSEYVSNYVFPIVLKSSNRKKRDEVRNYLHQHGVQTSVHYPSVHKFSIYKNASFILPETEYVSDNEITLPMYGSLREDEVKYICNKIGEAKSNG